MAGLGAASGTQRGDKRTLMPRCGTPSDTLDAMSDEARQDEIYALLKMHPAIRAWQRREEHDRALQYLYVNAEGLIALIDQLNEDGLGLLLMTQSPVPDEDDEAWRQFLIELGRRWHNYAASAVTVVDHTRRLMEGESTSFSEQCAAARAVQLDNPVIQFTHRSRVYLLHLGVFNPTVRMQLACKRCKSVWYVGVSQAKEKAPGAWRPSERSRARSVTACQQAASGEPESCSWRT